MFETFKELLNSPLCLLMFCFIGTWAGTLGTAVLIGGGGYLAAKGMQKPKAYKGAKPPTSLMETQAGHDYYKTLEQRLKGIGVGIPKERFTALETGMKDLTAEDVAREKEAAATGLSSAGLGRSSLRGAKFARAERLGGLDLRSKIAQLRLKQEELRREDINDALARQGAFGQAEAGQMGTRAEFEYGDYSTQLAFEEERKKRMLDTVSGLGIGAMTAGQNQDILDELEYIKTKTGPTVARI